MPIGLLWCNMKLILLLCGHDERIINLESTYIGIVIVMIPLEILAKDIKIMPWRLEISSESGNSKLCICMLGMVHSISLVCLLQLCWHLYSNLSFWEYGWVCLRMITMNHIFIYLILTKLLSLFFSLTINSILNTYYFYYDNPHNCIYVFNLTCSFQCWSNSSFVSLPTTGTRLDSNPRLYQASRGIKYP